MRIHVLGIGSIGTLVSHHLRLANPSLPISLIAKKAAHFRKSKTRLFPYGQADVEDPELEVERDGRKVTSTAYEIEKWHDGEFERQLVAAEGIEALPGIAQHPGGLAGASLVQPLPNTSIDSLIVCLKAQLTTRTLSILAPRIRPSSVVTLIQNGTGVYEELCETIWPNPTKRPQFILGTTTHGVSPSTSKLDGAVRHQSEPETGSIKFGVVPDPLGRIDFEDWLWGDAVGNLPILDPPSSPTLPLPETEPRLEPLRDTLTALLSLNQLNSELLPLPHLQHEQLVKVALNSIINPLTAILGAGALPNGSLIQYKAGYNLMEQLATETSDAISAYLLAKWAPNDTPSDIMRVFSSSSLLNTAMQLVEKTRTNTSSMAVDVARGRDTEIEYINGHIVRLGKKHRIATPCHEMVINMVRYTTNIGGAGGALKSSIQDRLSRLTDKRERLQAIQEGAPEFLSRSRMELEQQKMVNRQANLSVKQAVIDEGKRQRRKEARRLARHQLAVIKDFFVRRGLETPYPTPGEWRKLGWRSKARVLKSAINDVGGTEGWTVAFGKHATKEGLQEMLQDLERRSTADAGSKRRYALETATSAESTPADSYLSSLADAETLSGTTSGFSSNGASPTVLSLNPTADSTADPGTSSVASPSIGRSRTKPIRFKLRVDSETLPNEKARTKNENASHKTRDKVTKVYRLTPSPPIVLEMPDGPLSMPTKSPASFPPRESLAPASSGTGGQAHATSVSSQQSDSSSSPASTLDSAQPAPETPGAPSPGSSDAPIETASNPPNPTTQSLTNPPDHLSSTPVSEDTPSFQSGVSSVSIDSLIASAPREERTWDVPSTPPSVRGPVPKKRTVPDTPVPPSQLVPPGGQASLGVPGLPTARPTGRMANWMDGMITSAPRQERTWDVSQSISTGKKDMKKASISYRQGS